MVFREFQHKFPPLLRSISWNRVCFFFLSPPCRCGATVAARRCTFLSCLTAELLEPGNAGGRGRGAAESGRLLLAAEHRDPGDGAEGEGPADPGGAAPHGGGPGGMCRGDRPAKPRNRPKKQGADREVRDA
uniref:(northern house mosquito) hypothetical protein n=1 Tax=Culex pipiens TaxID=7175 RepID=A0A8D8KEB3_CULPI